MAAPTAVPRDASDWIAWAVASAHAARDAVARLDGTLPDQPLAAIARAGGLRAPCRWRSRAGSASRFGVRSGAASSTAAARRTTPTWRARWRARCAASRRS